MYITDYCLDGQYRCKVCGRVCGDAFVHRDPELKYHIPKEAKEELCAGCYNHKISPGWGIGDQEEFVEHFSKIIGS